MAAAQRAGRTARRRAAARRPGDTAVDHRGHQEGRLRGAARAGRRRPVRGVELAGHQHRRGQDVAAGLARRCLERQAPRRHRVRRRHRAQGVGAEGGPRPGRLPGDQGCQGRVPAPARHRRQDRPGRLPDGRQHRRRSVDAGEAAPATGAGASRGATADTRAAEGAGRGDHPGPRRTPSSTAGSARTTTPTPSTPCSPPLRSRSSTTEATLSGC